MEKSSNATELVRDHFREKASSFDALYDEEHLLQRAVRPGLLRRRDFAIEVVREYSEPRVLDIGGGSGRVGELALEAGAGEYVNADIAPEMLDLCGKSAIGSFPRWNWLKGPVRKLRYEVIDNCPIYDYTEQELRFLFGKAGFGRVLIKQGRSGFLVRA